MTYRDDFYIRDNIVGYTATDGNIRLAPTIYFETEDEHGRITQDHVDRNNVGRSEVRNKILLVLEGKECVLYQYKATNGRWLGDGRFDDSEIEEGELVEEWLLYERYEARSGLNDGGELLAHESRNMIVTNLTEWQKAILADAVLAFPRQKAKRGRGDRYVPMGPFAFLTGRKAKKS